MLHSIDSNMIAGLAMFVFATTRLMEPGKRRMWVLSCLVTPVMTLFGGVFAAGWMIGAPPSPYCSGVLELAKSYFIVDLAYCAAFHWDDTALLDCWIHHLFYIFYLDHLVYTGQVAVTQPFIIMELPTAIRTVSYLWPSLRRPLYPLFIGSFLAFRIAWPAYVITHTQTTTANFTVSIAMLILHCYWAGQMVWRRLRAAPPAGHY